VPGDRLPLLRDRWRKPLNGDLIAVIPARGGSQRVPRKNIRQLGGQPLLAFTIAAAREAGLADATLVSTEDPEIAEVATRLGCHALARPAALATDLASTESVLLHALDEMAKQDWHPIWVMTLPPTSPFRRARTIRFFMKHLECGADCVFSLTETRASLWCCDSSGKASRLFPESARRQQDRDSLYEENSAVYLTSVAALRETGSILGRSQRAIVIDPLEGFDINTELDFVIANALVAAEPALEPRPLWP
jgi:CMP-N,N'-diacetyllegionaminic acid synthase